MCSTTRCRFVQRLIQSRGGPSERGLGRGSRNRARVQRVVREHVQRPAIAAAEQQPGRPLGHVDPADRLARRPIHEDLAVGDVHVALAVGDDALAASLGERLEISQRAVVADDGAVGAVLGAARDVDALPRAGR